MGNCFAWFHRLLLRDKQLYSNSNLIILSRKRHSSSFFPKHPSSFPSRSTKRAMKCAVWTSAWLFPPDRPVLGRKRQRAAMADAACCDGRCSALRWPMQRVAMADAPYCVCRFSQKRLPFHPDTFALSAQYDSRFGTIGFGEKVSGRTGKESWGEAEAGFLYILYSERNMAASASECTCSRMMG